MKFPAPSVFACFTVCLTPSRSNVTKAPASGLPLLSLTLPVMVAKDVRLDEAARVSIRENDTTASRDKQRLKALLMQTYLRELDLPIGSNEGGEHPQLYSLTCAINSLAFILFSQSPRRRTYREKG